MLLEGVLCCAVTTAFVDCYSAKQLGSLRGQVRLVLWHALLACIRPEGAEVAEDGVGDSHGALQRRSRAIPDPHAAEQGPPGTCAHTLTVSIYLSRLVSI